MLACRLCTAALVLTAGLLSVPLSQCWYCGRYKVATKFSSFHTCRRPRRTCLCETLPAHRISTWGHVIVLQHPNEYKCGSMQAHFTCWQQRSPRAFLELSQEALGNCCARTAVPAAMHRPPRQKVQGEPLTSMALGQTQNRFPLFRHGVTQVGMHPAFDAALDAASLAGAPVYVLFPGGGAADVSEVARTPEHRRCLAARPRTGRLPPFRQKHDAAVPAVAVTEQCADSGAAGSHEVRWQGQSCGPWTEDPERQGSGGCSGYGGKIDQCSASAGAIHHGGGRGGPCARHEEAPGLGCRGPGSAPPLGDQALSTDADKRPLEPSNPAYLLIVVDGTWQQANEMFRVRAREARETLTIC